MPPEDAAPAAPNAAVVVPPADQPPPAREVPFADRFAAMAEKLGGLDDEGDDEPAADDKKPAEAPAAAKPDKKPEAKAKPPEAKPDAVTPSERAEFREAKQKHQNWYSAKVAELDKREKELSSTHGERIGKADAILKAIEAGDPEGFATAVGTKDFNEFQESFIKRLADPNYKELREIQRKLAEKEAKEEADQKTATQQAENRKRAEAHRGYMTDLQAKAKTSSDKLAVAMADDGIFANTIFAVQKANWSDADQKTVTIEEALDLPIPGTKTTLRAEMKSLHERLSKVFSEPPALAAANGRKPGAGSKTAVTPPKTTDSAGGAGTWKTQKEWRAYANAELAKAKD